MRARWQIDPTLDEERCAINLHGRLTNASRQPWRRTDDLSVGWQLYDPETGTFIAEGQWHAIDQDVALGEAIPIDLSIAIPPERGEYHVYVSLIHPRRGWAHAANLPFYLVHVAISDRPEVIDARVTTRRALRLSRAAPGLRKALTLPFLAVWRNRSLVHSMVRRDILARYRGSFAGVFWTVLNPLLLMVTYWFVFGVVLQTRFAGDASGTGFVLYFLAGMLPWLAFSEAAGRAPNVVLEHRNFVKKLVFPVETLPVNLTAAGLVTEVFALAVFLIFLAVARGGLPATTLWVPALLLPQLLLTAGMAWFLAATGAYLRDLGQVIGFLLTLWFFLTPICYPETALPGSVAAVLTNNPMYVLVRAYRDVLLEARAPDPAALLKLCAFAAAIFFGGYAWFYKLRRGFADVI